MLKYNNLPKLVFLVISLTVLSATSTSASLHTSIKPKTQEVSIDCCVDNYHSWTGANSKGVKGEIVKVAVQEDGKILIKPIKSFFSIHETVRPVENNTAFNIPAGKFGGKTRVSLNFNHRSWVPHGSNPIRVRFTVRGVNDDIRRIICVQMKADKRVGGRDGNRSRVLKHGSVFDLKYGTNRDRGYYFAGRNGIRPEDLPKGAYFRLEHL